MRVGVVMVYHEANTFIPARVTLDDFRADTLLEGDAVRQAFHDSHHELGGFFEVLEETGVEAAPLFAARMVAGGVVAEEAYRAIRNGIDRALRVAPAVDGLLVAAHGASVSEDEPDMDGHWLGDLRNRVGPDVPLIATCDPHANLSPSIVDACDALIAYRTNPHLDQMDRGREAARMMVRTLRGEIRPVQSACFPPMLINIDKQSTRDEPCRSLVELADAMRHRDGVLSDSVMLGFPYADVPHVGSSCLVVTDGDADLARRCADELGAFMWRRREAFLPRLIDVESAIDIAERRPGPVCLLDMGDNVGGGAPGDGTTLAHALRRRGRKGMRSFVSLCDPESADLAREAGAGQRVQLSMGGKSAAAPEGPLVKHVVVRSLHPGRFEETEIRHSALNRYDMGPTAIVETDEGVTVQLTSTPVLPFSLGQLTSCGLDPGEFHILVAKGVHAPVAAYAPVCKSVMRVNTPGVTAADVERLTFHHRRRPMYPFERDTSWGG